MLSSHTNPRRADGSFIKKTEHTPKPNPADTFDWDKAIAMLQKTFKKLDKK